MTGNKEKGAQITISLNSFIMASNDIIVFVQLVFVFSFLSSYLDKKLILYVEKRIDIKSWNINNLKKMFMLIWVLLSFARISSRVVWWKSYLIPSSNENNLIYFENNLIYLSLN